MTRGTSVLIALMALLTCGPSGAVAADAGDRGTTDKDNHQLELPKGLEGLSIGTLAYVSYQDGTDASGEDYSKFVLKRGYVNIKKKVTRNLEVRITPDVHLDSSGDYKVRLKYLYAKFKWDGNEVIAKPYLEFGVAHMPWLDFEEHINRFRLQDTMFMERNGLFNSADAGVMFGANLGASLDEDYVKNVNDHYAGRWGSFQVGVFNGGGYHAAEKNTNKVIEGRFTLRPLPDAVPGLQVSVLGIDGEGNRPAESGVKAPDWKVLTGMLSYESRLVVATAQFYEGEGNQKGIFVGADGMATEQDGYSFFAEVRCARHEEWSVFARYDSFDTDTEDPASDVKDRWIGGLAWQFHKGNYWVLDYDRLEHTAPGIPTEDRVQLTLQLKY